MSLRSEQDWHQDFVRTVESESDGMEILSLGLKENILCSLSQSSVLKYHESSPNSTLPGG